MVEERKEMSLKHGERRAGYEERMLCVCGIPSESSGLHMLSDALFVFEPFRFLLC